MTDSKLTYRDAGVDIDAASQSVQKIKKLARATFGENVLSEIGSFGGMYAFPKGYKNPVIVSSADGVGTKLKIAFRMSKHDTVGIDIVNHCANDILVQGARPLFFMDYLACGKLEQAVVHQVLAGIVKACQNIGIALLGGETAQLSDFYQPGEYDLAGFIVGVVDKKKIIDGQTIAPGDLLIGLPSNGLHTNGYTLARKVLFDIAGLDINTILPGLGEKLGDVLLRPHPCYLNLLKPLLDEGLIKGLAHITGGGIPGNLIRILPENCQAIIDTSTWSVPPIFEIIAQLGKIEEPEMYRVFNMGIGMIMVTSPTNQKRVLSTLSKSVKPSGIIGRIVAGNRSVQLLPH